VADEKTDDPSEIAATSSPFDPPRPPDQSARDTAGIIAGGVGALGAFVVLDHCTGGLLGALTSLPSCDDDPAPIDVNALLQAMPELAATAPPELTADRKALCTRCAAAVDFASMSLSEHGYFCATCAASSR
jgi:hypothetical protein